MPITKKRASRPRAKYVKPADFENKAEHLAQKYSVQEVAEIFDIFYPERDAGNRVRTCEICEKIFWQTRNDATCCSRVCANRLRQRQFYQRKTESRAAINKTMNKIMNRTVNKAQAASAQEEEESKTKAKYTVPKAFYRLLDLLEDKVPIEVIRQVVEAADPENFNADLIRSCRICSHIFWAKRVKSQTCSGKCLNAWSARCHRSRLVAVAEGTANLPG